MGLSAFDRLFDAREIELAKNTPPKQIFDPLFPVEEAGTAHVPYDPIGEHDFIPATDDGK